MADYKRMYSVVFNAATDAIKLLQEAQQTAEEIFISGDDAVLHFIRQPEDKEESDDQ